MYVPNLDIFQQRCLLPFHDVILSKHNFCVDEVRSSHKRLLIYSLYAHIHICQISHNSDTDTGYLVMIFTIYSYLLLTYFFTFILHTVKLHQLLYKSSYKNQDNIWFPTLLTSEFLIFTCKVITI